MQEAGADAVLETAFTLADGLEYCRSGTYNMYLLCMQLCYVLGCICIGTSAGPSTRIRVPVNTSLHVFQWRPFTLILVLYEYGLPVHFTHV